MYSFLFDLYISYELLEQVTARWHPEEARRPDLQDAPVFYPSEEVFIATPNTSPQPGAPALFVHLLQVSK